MRIDKDWAHPDLFRQTPRGDGVWEGIRFTMDPITDCDLLIVLNGPSRDIRVRCPAGRRWLFTQESPVEQYRWHTASFGHFDQLFTFWEREAGSRLVREHTGLPWQINKTYLELTKISIADAVAAKQRMVSWVTSNATHKPGHALRMNFLAHLKEQRFDFDLFGRGFTPIGDKFDGLFPYRYSIAIENYSCVDYWTEKIADCFLSWTIPIYWGAKNVLSYFPPRSILLIDPADPAGGLARIKSAIADGYYEQNIDALAEARDSILEKHQFFPHVARLIQHFAAGPSVPRLKYSIPINPVYCAGEDVVRRSKRLVSAYARSAIWSLR